MAKVTPISEHFQHFLVEMKETFWGDLYGETRLAWQRFFELQSERQRDRFAVREAYGRRRHRGQPYRNGYYERDFVTRLGTLRLRIARTREKSFLPAGLERFQRRAEEVSMLIREAFLRGISTRQVGRVVATLTGEVVSAQTVSKLTRDLDEAVRQFHQARLSDDYAYLFLDGVSLRVRRPAGRKRVQMLVAYGVRRDGTRHLLAFLRSQGESQADWEGLLQDLYRRGLEGKHLALIITDGCAGLAAAIPTVYPRARHQRCWVHKMRNILQKVRKADYDEVKTGAQAIYLAEGRGQAEAAFRRFRARWRKDYGSMVRRLERDSARTAGLFRFSPAPVAQAQDDQCDRTLLRRSSAAHPADGVLCECRERGPHHLLHLPEIQPEMENPHPLRIYTSSLTSPLRAIS
jgi:putative transposase